MVQFRSSQYVFMTTFIYVILLEKTHMLKSVFVDPHNQTQYYCIYRNCYHIFPTRKTTTTMKKRNKNNNNNNNSNNNINNKDVKDHLRTGNTLVVMSLSEFRLHLCVMFPSELGLKRFDQTIYEKKGTTLKLRVHSFMSYLY